MQDRLTEHYRSTADHYHNLHRQSNTSAIDQIRADDLDVLIDLPGSPPSPGRPSSVPGQPPHPQLPRLSRQPGSHYVDGLLADAQLIPAEQEANYPEQVFRLPHAFASRWRQPGGHQPQKPRLARRCVCVLLLQQGRQDHCQHLLQLDNDSAGGAETASSGWL